MNYKEPSAAGSREARKKGLIKAPEEIEIIAQGGKILHNILEKTAGLAKPGISTWELNEFAENAITNAGGRPSFKGYGHKKNAYPAGLCTSLNDEVVHGIPSRDKILKSGDVLSLDIGMEFKGFYTDHAVTIGIGGIPPRMQNLINTTKKSLAAAIGQAKAGNRIGDISFAMQSTAEAEGFATIRDLVGHGVGYDVHEDPAVPCFGKKATGEMLREGMVLAIEPMLCEHEYFVTVDPDGWTIRTADGGISAHFEHTVAITKNGARILT